MIRIFAISTLLTASFLVPSAPASAAPKRARCVISNNSDGVFLNGPCLFDADRDGSFVISPVKGTFLVPQDDESPGITQISLDVERRGRGEVRGLTGAGMNSRWGPATRSAKDRACWVGEDFRLCVY